MFRTIVVGYDASQQANDALTFAQQLRDRDGDRLIVAAVVPLARGVLLTAPDDHVRNLHDKARLELERAVERFGADVPYELVPIGDTSPARGLHELAEERNADLIVLGSSHRHGLGITTGRATVQRLLHGAPCPLAVAAPGQVERFGSKARICVAYDGSPESRLALDAAYALAQAHGATVEVLRVSELLASPFGLTPYVLAGHEAEEIERRAQSEVDEAVARAPHGVFASGCILKGPVTFSLLGRAEFADLLVAGSRSYGPLHRVLAGSTSIGLLTDGRVPVLVMPRAGEHHARAAADDAAELAAR